MADQHDIDKIAAEVEAWGNEQTTVAGEASRGAFDAINGLVGLVTDLVKGKADTLGMDANSDEAEEGRGADDVGDDADPDVDDSADDADADDEGGFQDMEFGRDDVILDNAYDVTEFTQDLDNKVNAIGRELQRSRREARQLRKGMAELKGIILTLAQKDAAVSVQLAKAVSGLTAGVTSIPQRSAFNAVPNRDASAGVSGVKVDTGHYLGGDERTEKFLLLKGMNAGILDEGQKRHYYLHRVFDADQAEDKRIRDELQSLNS
jgi:hypothetical protein